MARQVLGAEPVKIASAGQAPAVQNLGPGVIYLDTRSDVTPTGATGGIRVAVDALYELPRDLTRDLYAVADAANTDVRIMMVG